MSPDSVVRLPAASPPAVFSLFLGHRPWLLARLHATQNKILHLPAAPALAMAVGLHSGHWIHADALCWTSGKLMGVDSAAGAASSVLLLFLLLQACDLDQITGISPAILDHTTAPRCKPCTGMMERKTGAWVPEDMWRCSKTPSRPSFQRQLTTDDIWT